MSAISTFPASTTSPLLARGEAANYCRVSLRTFDRRVAPDLRSVHIGSRVFYDRRDIDTWLEGQKVTDSAVIPMESGTSDSGSMAGVSIGPLERKIAERLIKGHK